MWALAWVLSRCDALGCVWASALFAIYIVGGDPVWMGRPFPLVSRCRAEPSRADPDDADTRGCHVLGEDGIRDNGVVEYSLDAMCEASIKVAGKLLGRRSGMRLRSDGGLELW